MALTLWMVLLLFISCGLARGRSREPFINWKDLHNPVLSYPNWSIKDAAMAYRNGRFYVFFSAFYKDHGRVRSHVVEVSTLDFKTYSKPIFDFDGEKAGWIGMCSPDVENLGNTWELSFNSWGDDPKRPDHLFYMTSQDLVHWSARHPLAANLTAGEGVIDLSVARQGSNYYAIWKGGRHPRRMHPRLAEAKSLSGPWHYVGSGNVSLLMANGKENGLIHENFEFVSFDGKWHVLSADYPHAYPHHEILYTLLNDRKWLDWGAGFELKVPVQGFNRFQHHNAGALYDWRKYDGYFYLIYAGNNEKKTYLHRGWNRLALARSKDLIHWFPAGVMNRQSTKENHPPH